MTKIDLIEAPEEFDAGTAVVLLTRSWWVSHPASRKDHRMGTATLFRAPDGSLFGYTLDPYGVCNDARVEWREPRQLVRMRDPRHLRTWAESCRFDSEDIDALVPRR